MIYYGKMIYYVSIGNSDDKLSQRDWAAFYVEVDEILRWYATTIHGAWMSESVSPWQNACWRVEFLADPAEAKTKLAECAARFNQDSIAWATVNATEFLNSDEEKK